MAKSIIQKDRGHCFLCGRNARADFLGLEEHHIFEGYGKRELSEQYGLKVYICGDRCHKNGKYSVHKNAKVARELKAKAQEIAMQHYGWSVEDFISIIGKNYL